MSTTKTTKTTKTRQNARRTIIDLSRAGAALALLLCACTATVEAQASLGPGTYMITSGGQAVDGGYGYWNDYPAVAFYATTPSNPYQSWTLGADGRLANVEFTGHYLADNGNGTVTENASGDSWTVLQSGSGYTFRDNVTGNYLTNNNGTLGMAAQSGGSNQVFVATQPSGSSAPPPSSGPSLAPGTYVITSGGEAVDGGYGYWNDYPAVAFYATTPGNSYQSWTLGADGRLSNVEFTGHYMADNGNGTVTENASGDSWTVLQSGSGYTFRDNVTGNYLTNNNGTLGMAAQSGGSNQVFGATQPSGSSAPPPSSGPSLAPGTYVITSGGEAVDGGYGYWNDYPAVAFYATTPGNSYQSWTLGADGRLANVEFTGHYMADNGNGTVTENASGHSWTVHQSGSGYTFQDNVTGNYLTSNNGTLGMAAQSGSANQVFGATQPSGNSSDPPPPSQGPSSGPPLATGTYVITSGGEAVDGGYGYWNDYPAVAFYATSPGNSYQSWTLGADGRLANVEFTGHYMADDGNGTVTENASGDSWTVLQSGSGYTFQDNATGNYLTSNNGTLGMAAQSGGSNQVFVATQPSGSSSAPSASAPNFTHILVDPTVPTDGSDRLEKVLADVDGDGLTDAVLGQGTGHGGAGGLFWYQAPHSGDLTQSWNKYTIAPSGNFYERAVAYDVNGDGALDIIASDNSQTVWFENPRGHGGDPTQPWVMHVINPNAGAHDIRLADLDGDGKTDVICSSSDVLGSGAFVAFQNTPDSWQIVTVANVGEGVSLLDIGSGNGAINLVGADENSGNLYWYENPRESGGNARKPNWNAWLISPIASSGVSIQTGALLAQSPNMDVVVASNESPAWPQGLVWFEAPADRRNGTWIQHTIDSGYLDVHQIDVQDMNFNGTNDIIVAEQEQAAWDHPGTPPRVTIFFNDGNGNFTPDILSTSGGHNQVVGDMNGHGDLGILSSNHGFYGAYNPLELWVMNPQAK